MANKQMVIKCAVDGLVLARIVAPRHSQESADMYTDSCSCSEHGNQSISVEIDGVHIFTKHAPVPDLPVITEEISLFRRCLDFIKNPF